VRGHGIQLLERGDQVPNATGSVTSTVSQSQSLGLSADLGSLGMTNSKGWSFSRTLGGFKVRASGGARSRAATAPTSAPASQWPLPRRAETAA
jgi:hypothetical protein